MTHHQLLAKQLKCVFGISKVEYLVYFISYERVTTDPKKILVVKGWPIPSNLKQLRGFLVLFGYYMKFIKGMVALVDHSLIC